MYLHYKTTILKRLLKLTVRKMEVDLYFLFLTFYEDINNYKNEKEIGNYKDDYTEYFKI